MNSMPTRQLVRNFWRLAVIASLLGALSSARTAEPVPVPAPTPAPALVQGQRFLLLFETSRGLKKNLPAIRQEIAHLFSSNLQNQIQAGDDLAVWTVDESLHTGSFPMANWMPDEAEECARRVDGFLDLQKFTRHPNLAAMQPQLNRLAKHSERLTVIIFCDSQSRLVGTPYDSGVNDIITNATAKTKGDAVPFILVLRSYLGEYIGCSVNRTSDLSFPNFPKSPKPTPQAPAGSAPVVAQPAPPTTPVTGPIVKPVPALIIVGTKASTNAEAAAKLMPTSPAPVSASVPASIIVSNVPPAVVAPTPNPPPPVILPAPAASTPAPAPTLTPVPAPEAAPRVVTPPPVSAPAAPVAVEAKPAGSGPETFSKPVVAAPLTPPPALEPKPAEAVVETGSSGRWFILPLAIGVIALVGATALVTWLMLRSRRPPGSLITTSLQNHPRLPPRK